MCPPITQLHSTITFVIRQHTRSYLWAAKAKPITHSITRQILAKSNLKFLNIIVRFFRSYQKYECDTRSSGFQHLQLLRLHFPSARIQQFYEFLLSSSAVPLTNMEPRKWVAFNFSVQQCNIVRSTQLNNIQCSWSSKPSCNFPLTRPRNAQAGSPGAFREL